MNEETLSEAPGGTKNRNVLWMAGILILIVIALLGWTAMRQRAASKGPSTAAEVQALVARVAKHIVVKQDETPSVAVVQDADLLRKQNSVFYKDAQNGDRLLVWSDKAVLYSPSRDVILTVLSLNIPLPQNTNATQASSSTVTETATIEVRNGSGVSGLGKTVSAKLKENGLNVIKVGDAAGGYERTLIVAVSAKSLPKTLAKIKADVKGTVGSLPAGEAATKADILIIVGKEYK